LGSEEYMRESIKVISNSESWMFLSNTKSVFYELLENWISFFIYYTPVAIILGYFGGNASVLRGIMLLLPIALMVIIRRRIRKMIFFIGLNILIITSVYFLFPSLLEKVFFVMITAIYFIYSFRKRYEEVIDFLKLNFMLISGVFLILCYLVAYYLKLTFMTNYITIVSINTVLCCSLYFHLTRTQKLLEWETSYAAKFLRRIKKMTMTTVAILSVLIAALNLFLWKSGIFSLMDYIQQRIVNFFKFDKKVETKAPKTPVEPPVNSQGNMGDMFQDIGDSGDTSIFLLILMKIIEFAFTVIIIIALVYILWMLYLKLKELYRMFYARDIEGSEKRERIIPIEDISNEIVSRIKSVRNDLSSIFERSNRKKVRNAYNKIILKYKNKGIQVSASSTPLELQNEIEVKNKLSFQEVTIIYEKARYSTMQCSDEEVSRIKKYI
jgi:hypothetical protein